MSWKKEKKEHPWASNATVKRIASDHAKKKNHTKQTSGLFNQKVPLQHLPEFLGKMKETEHKAASLPRRVH